MEDLSESRLCNMSVGTARRSSDPARMRQLTRFVLDPSDIFEPLESLESMLLKQRGLEYG
jgi:hypothetical protein